MVKYRPQHQTSQVVVRRPLTNAADLKPVTQPFSASQAEVSDSAKTWSKVDEPESVALLAHIPARSFCTCKRCEFLRKAWGVDNERVVDETQNQC